MPETIAIRDPVIRKLVAAEQRKDRARTATETAEHLIRDGVEWRRIQKATGGALPLPTPDGAATSQARAVG